MRRGAGAGAGADVGSGEAVLGKLAWGLWARRVYLGLGMWRKAVHAEGDVCRVC